MGSATDNDGGYFSAASSDIVVNSRIGSTCNERLRAIMTIMTRHLHAAVKEAQITNAEWMGAITFLTETGQICTDVRQEYILLSDVLGVSMLVDALSHERPEGATENTVLGPFHVDGVPHYEHGTNICLDGKGEPLEVFGTVRDASGNPIPGAVLDVWQANEDGYYDVQQVGVQPKHNLRGKFVADDQGRYQFLTVKPRYYPIPDDGPVGKLLNGLGRHPNRPAHLHFIVTASGYETVTTHIFAPDCPYLAEDAVFGVKQSLIADFVRIEDRARREALGLSDPFWSVNWDFVLVSEGQQNAAESL